MLENKNTSGVNRQSADDVQPGEWWCGWSQSEIEADQVSCCAVCGGENFTFFAQGYDYELGTCPNRWVFDQCGGCGHVFLNPRPTISALKAIYPTHYYSYNMGSKINPWILRGKRWLDGKRLNAIIAAFGKTPRSYLDVGCGDGKYLEDMQSKGVSASDLYGIELDEAAVQRAKARGYRVFNSSVDTCDAIPLGSIDVISLFHVIEHLPDPSQTVRKLVGWMAPGAILAIETPNRDSIDARLFREAFWGGYHIPRHWHLFDSDGITNLLVDHGLTVVRRKYVSGHSFWLYSFHHWLAYNTRYPMPKFAKLFDPLRSRGALLVVTAYDYLRAALGFKTSSVLVMARKI